MQEVAERSLSKERVKEWLTICEFNRSPHPKTVENIYDNYVKNEFVDLFGIVGDEAVFPFFVLIQNEMDDESYYKVLGRVLTCETYSADVKELMRFFLNNPNRNNSLKHNMMNEEELLKLDSLPEEISIFRGTRIESIGGYSWTLDVRHAEFFAKRHNNSRRYPIIVQGTCLKSDVIAFFSREDEIFISPEHVSNSKIIKFVKDVFNHSSNPKLSGHLNVLEKLRASKEYRELEYLAKKTVLNPNQQKGAK